MNSTRWIDGMLGAIEDEMDARRRPDGVQILTLGPGRCAPYGTPSEEHIYDFAVPDAAWVPGLLGGDLHLPGGRVHPVSVVSWPSSGPLSLSSPNDLGPEIADADLHYHDDRLLRLLRQRIKDCSSGLSEAIDGVCGGGEMPADPVRAASRAIEGLNPDQEAAVRMALTVPRGRIWGPPGTGKTRTAAALATAWIGAGRTLVLAGPTNRSTDLLLYAVLCRLGWDRSEIEGRFIRLGTLHEGPLRDRWGEVVALDKARERRISQAREDLADIREEISHVRSVHPSLRPPEFEPGGLEALLVLQRQLEVDVGVSSAQLLDRAQVVATTAYRVAMGQVRGRDALILDEASMVSLPVGLLTALAADRTVLVGDPRQLGPVVQSRTARARTWLGTSVFADPSESRSADPAFGGPSVLLATQYRMPQPVCDLVSDMSYEGRLLTHPDVREQRLSGPALSYINLADIDLQRPSEPGRRLANTQQAALALQFASEALHHDPQLGGQIAVISPYRAHVRALRAAARKQGMFLEFHLTTVHRTQGHEYRLVVLSLPERRGERLSPFMRGIRISDEGGRLLTVAASRASERLVVVGDLGWLAQSAPPGGALESFLWGLKKHGEPLICTPYERSSIHDMSACGRL